ncbi:MAG: hypothetical protein Q9174_004346 [Haloplaca sp. 1 TL-2023]
MEVYDRLEVEVGVAKGGDCLVGVAEDGRGKYDGKMMSHDEEGEDGVKEKGYGLQNK